jgi:plastocyanin
MKVRTILLGFATALAVTACSGSDYSSTPTAPSSSGGGTASGGGTSSGGTASGTQTITITSRNGAQSFSPNPASMGGQTVVFRNADGIVHRVVLNDNSVDTGDIAPGATSRAVTMPGSGTNYHCSLHPDMIGAVNPAAGGPPPPCEGIYCK